MCSGCQREPIAAVHEAQHQPYGIIALVDRIAARLQERPTLPRADRPDVIIVDEVSRALGDPDLTDYARGFAHGGLEAWVIGKDDPLGPEPPVLIDRFRWP